MLNHPKRILIINGHQFYPVVAEGNLTRSFIQTATETLHSKGYEVKTSSVENYDVAEELEKFQWARCCDFSIPVQLDGLGVESQTLS